MSPRYARALRVLAEIQRYEIVHLQEKFDRADIKDPDWLRALGAEGDWVIVSGDPRITRGRAEQEAWRESRLTAFFFAHGWSSRQYWKQAADVVAWWPAIVLEARQVPPGTGFLIPLKGTTWQKIYDPL